MSKSKPLETESPAAKPTTWTGHAYAMLRQDILFGVLRPGSRLKIEELNQRYQVGPTPLREALARLASEGLVQSEQLKGFRVALVSLKELEELCELRVMIETEALRRSIALGDEHWEGNIVASFHKLDRLEQKLEAGETIDPAEWEDRNRDFHQALVAAAGSEWLLRMREHLWDHHERYRRYGRILLVRSPSASVNAEHRDMMESALKRDPDRAAKILREHINFTIGLLRDRFEKLAS